VQEAKSRGFVFWKAEEINAWERSRRQVRIQTSGEGVDMQVALTLQAGAEAASASEASGKADGIPAKTVVWIPLPAGQASPEAVLKFGVPCLKKVVS
jgi:hypothetical protein